MMTLVISPLSSCAINSLKITSSSGACAGTLNRLNSKIMNRPTTTQNSRFLTREFIQLLLAFQLKPERRHHQTARNSITAPFGLTTGSRASVTFFIDLIQDRQIGQIAILLLVIESIAHHILVGNLEADIVERDVYGAPLGFAEQGTDAN